MRREGKQWREIAEAVGRTKNQCACLWHYENEKHGKLPAPKPAIPEAPAFDDSLTTPDALRDLAIAKMLVMLQDLAGDGISSGNVEISREIYRLRAERWFFGKSDMPRWCEMAGLEPDYVRRGARRVLEGGAAYFQRAKAHSSSQLMPRDDGLGLDWLYVC